MQRGGQGADGQGQGACRRGQGAAPFRLGLARPLIIINTVFPLAVAAFDFLSILGGIQLAKPPFTTSAVASRLIEAKPFEGFQPAV